MNTHTKKTSSGKSLAARLSLLALALTLIITGCSSLPPINGTYITDDGDVGTLIISSNAIDIVYTENTNKTNIATQLHPVAGIHAGLNFVDPAAYNGWKGTCPGCTTDAAVMYEIPNSYGFPAIALLNQAATTHNIKEQVRKLYPAITPNGLLIITVSAHGSRERDTNGDEADGYEELTCLYNGRLSGDVIWLWLSELHDVRPDIRILLISDTCHAEGHFRAPPRLAPSIRTLGRFYYKSEISLLHFAGCRAAKYSYGSSQGGVWSTALIDAFDTSLTYADWFTAAAALMPPNQRPVIEHTGTYFGDRQIFK